jgi:iron complex outermembrane receptor protein
MSRSNQMTSLIALIGGLCAPAWANAAEAAAQEPAAPAQVAPQGDQLDEIVVTARKVTENLQDVPVAVTAITAADLEKRQIVTPEQLQYSVPSMSIQRAGSDSGQSLTIGLRGQMASTLTLNVDPAVALYFDGFNIPRPYGFRQNLIDVSQIEVLRGPQGTLYGRNSTGGAVAIYSTDPEKNFGGSAKAAYGSRNSYEIEGILNVPLGSTAALRLVGSETGSDGYGRNFFGQRVLGSERARYLRAKLLWEPSDRLTLRLLGSYTDSSGGGAPARLSAINPAASAYAGTLNELAVYNGIVTQAQALAPGFTLTPAQRTQAETIFRSYMNVGFHDSATAQEVQNSFKSPLVTMTIDWKATDSLTIRSISGFQHYERLTRDDVDGTPPSQIDTRQRTNANVFSQEFQATLKTRGFIGVAGVYGQIEKGDEGSLSLQRPLTTRTLSVPDGSTLNKNFSVYAQGDLDLTSRLRLTLGGRYTFDRRGGVARSYTQNLDTGAITCGVPVTVRDNPAVCAATLSKTFKQPTWLASLNYKATDDVLLYAKVSRGFRAGGFNVRGAVALNFAPYDPEITTEYEVGAKMEFLDRRVRLNVAAFYTDYKNIQVSSRVFAMGLSATAINNAAKGRVRGIEAELLLRPFKGLNISASGSILDPKYTEFLDGTVDRSGQPFSSAKHSATLAIDYTLRTPIGDLTPHFDYSYKSTQYFQPGALFLGTVSQPPLSLFNARVGLTVDAWNTEFALNVQNLTNKRYLIGAIAQDAALGYNFVTPAEPRTISFQARKRF